MVVLNRISRFHLCLDVLRSLNLQGPAAVALTDHAMLSLVEHRTYIDRHFEDPPEIRDWVWTE